jgi:hypothetical protein
MAQMAKPKHVALDRNLIEDTIEKAVRSNFGEDTIASVNISFDEDEFEGDVVNIAVILNRSIDKK